MGVARSVDADGDADVVVLDESLGLVIQECGVGCDREIDLSTIGLLAGVIDGGGHQIEIQKGFAAEKDNDDLAQITGVLEKEIDRAPGRRGSHRPAAGALTLHIVVITI